MENRTTEAHVQMLDRILRRLSVKSRIVGGFLLIVCFMAGILPIVFQMHNSFQKQFNQVLNVEARADRLLLLASNQVMSSRVKFLRYYHGYLPSALIAVADIDRAKNLLNDANLLIFQVEQKKAVTAILDKVDHYTGLVEGFQGDGLQNAQTDYPRMVFQILHTGNDITLNIEKIVKNSEAHVASTIQTLQGKAAWHLKIMALAFLITLLVSLVISGFIARSITRPLSDLNKGIEVLRQGIRTARIPVDGEDELSLLAQTLNQLTSDLEKTTTSIDVLHKEIDLRAIAEKKLQQSHQELKETQNQLVQSEKLASIGELAAGVAHELNQPLMVVRGGGQLMLRQLKKETLNMAQLKDSLETIDKNTKRMKNIINHLRTFSRQANADHETMDVNQVINDSFLMMGEQLKLKDIDVRKALCANLPKCRGNASQLEQVILNLVANARDALLERVAKADLVQDRPMQIVISTATINGGNEIEIMIKDNGDGIAPDKRSHIFNPFFTTKEVGKGTGLGLSISYGIIQDHQGKIEIMDTGPQGTIFQIRLPCE